MINATVELTDAQAYAVVLKYLQGLNQAQFNDMARLLFSRATCEKIRVNPLEAFKGVRDTVIKDFCLSPEIVDHAWTRELE